jgi:hypothetical protein
MRYAYGANAKMQQKEQQQHEGNPDKKLPLELPQARMVSLVIPQ